MNQEKSSTRHAWKAELVGYAFDYPKNVGLCLAVSPTADQVRESSIAFINCMSVDYIDRGQNWLDQPVYDGLVRLFPALLI